MASAQLDWVSLIIIVDNILTPQPPIFILNPPGIVSEPVFIAKLKPSLALKNSLDTIPGEFRMKKGGWRSQYICNIDK